MGVRGRLARGSLAQLAVPDALLTAGAEAIPAATPARTHDSHFPDLRGLARLLRSFLVITLTLVAAFTAFAQNTGSVSGYAYLDVNADGVRQQGEPPLGNMGVVIDSPGRGTITRMTRSDGYYSATGLTEGRGYVVPNIHPELSPNIGNASGIKEFMSNGINNLRCDLPYVRRCSTVETKSVRWDVRRENCAYVRICVRNYSAFNWGWIEITKLPAGVKVTPNPVNLGSGVAPGKGRVLDLKFEGVRPETELCFMMTFHSPDKAVCCGQKVCIAFPECKCFNDTQTTIECFPGNRFKYTFQYQNLDPNQVAQICFEPKAPKTNLVFSPNKLTFNPAVGRGGILNGSTFISGNGVSGNMNVCFDVVFKRRIGTSNEFVEVCRKTICKRLPECGECEVCPCTFIPPHPFYENPVWAANNFPLQRSFCAVTCASAVDSQTGTPFLNDDFTLAVFQLQDYQVSPPALGNDWPAARPAFHNDNFDQLYAHTWTRKNMGQIFGLCIDRRGDIFVAQTSSYNADGTDGTLRDDLANVFKIQQVSGNINTFLTFGQAEDPGIVNDPVIPGDIEARDASSYWGSQRYPKLGDVCYSNDHDQIFVTNMGNGTITTHNAVTGALKDTFDPMGPDASGDGFAPRGELLWAVQYHCGRLYYSVWVEDFDITNTSDANYIRSVRIDSLGKFVKSSDRVEVVMPPLGTWVNSPFEGTSAPVSDIAFSPEGDMMVAEKGMGYKWADSAAGFLQSARADNGGTPAQQAEKRRAFTNSFPHQARGMLFRCQSGAWKLVRDSSFQGDKLFQVGGCGGQSSEGGVDFDRSERTPINYPQGRRVWFTEDCAANVAVYGIQGLPVIGGWEGNSILVDLDGVLGGVDKTTPGDVEFFGARP